MGFFDLILSLLRSCDPHSPRERSLASILGTLRGRLRFLSQRCSTFLVGDERWVAQRSLRSSEGAQSDVVAVVHCVRRQSAAKRP